MEDKIEELKPIPEESQAPFTWRKFGSDMLYRLGRTFTSRSFWIWVVSTFFVWRDNGSNTTLQWVAWIVCIVMFYGCNALKVKFAQAVGNAGINIGLNAGANLNKNISGIAGGN